MEEGAVQSPKSNMRRKWPHLGAVETIYEEESEHDQEQDDDDEDEDDEDCTDSTPSDSIIASPPTSLLSAVKAWTMAKERETDVAIHVQGSCFCLHKEPLTSKSSYLKRLLKESCRITVSPPLNITAKTFELIADYCYTGAIVITPVNVASLRIAAELLEMSNVDDGATKGENLRQKTETYFRRAIAVNKEYASIVLRSCLSQMPEAETSANLVSKCIEALALVDDRDNVVDYLQDIKTVHCEDFRLIAESLYKKLTRTEGQDLLYRIVDLYFKEYTGNITDEQKMGICNYIDCNILSPQLLVHAVQNPRLPLRFVVQAMFIEQLNTRRTVISAANNHEIKRTYYESPESDTLGALLQRDAALRQVAQLKSAMDATSSRIQSLEKELSVMRQVVQDSSVVASSQIDSGRSASFRLDLERKVGRGQAGSASALSYRSFRRKERKISDEEQSWGDSSSITRAEQKNLGRRLMKGLKSAFGVGTSNKKNTSQTSGGSKVDGGIGREGLPYFDPDLWKDMSANDSFAAALRNLGGVHTLPKPQPKDKSAKKKKRAVKRGESGSSRQETEGTGNSSATPDPELQVRDPELDSEALEVESPVLEPKRKKKKTDSSQKQVIDMTDEDPVKSAMEVVDVEGGSRPAHKFGKYPVRKVIGLMAELPSNRDWEVMEDQGLEENFKDIGDLWGQLGGRLAGFNTHALNSLKKEREFSAETLARVRKLDKDLDLERSGREALEASVGSKIKEAEMKKEAELAQKIADAETRADSAEKKVSGLEDEVAALKQELQTRKAPAEVIADFQKSKAYADALAKAAAAEVMRCWTVAEKHIKTDPGANAQSFIDLYIAVKNKVNAGGAEPEPYVAPGQDVDSDSSAESEPLDEEIPATDPLADKPPADDQPAV